MLIFPYFLFKYLLMGIVESSSLDQQYFGFRIYRLFEDGPLKKTGVLELEDFIIPPEEIVHNSVPFTDFIKQSINKEITLRVFNLKRRNFKEITVTPTTNWGDGKHGALGASVRYENYVSAHKNILRVLKVNENSLAQTIELIPGEDFIIALRPENEDIISLNSNLNKDPLTIFKTIIRDFLRKNIDIYIYNEKLGARVKRVLLETKENGEIMGCDVAYGKIHEFPKSGESLSIMENNRDKSQENSNLVVSSTESVKQDNTVISNEISQKSQQTNTLKDNNQTVSQENITQQTVLDEIKDPNVNKETIESQIPVIINKDENPSDEEAQKEEIVSSERKYDIF